MSIKSYVHMVIGPRNFSSASSSNLGRRISISSFVLVAMVDYFQNCSKLHCLFHFCLDLLVLAKLLVTKEDILTNFLLSPRIPKSNNRI